MGDIAQKAYLPVLSAKDLELHLYTRDREKLSRIGSQYRFQQLHYSLESIIESGVKAAFVHTATDSHEPIIEQLLLNGVHVYVDKPITYHYDSSKRLTELAADKNLTLMVGFNRRYAPAYCKCRQITDANMVIMQKNRNSLPGEVRTFVFDDFIHVVDTLRYIFSYPIHEMTVKGMISNGLLTHITIQLLAENGAIAMGIMNRDAGAVEEILEVFSPNEKYQVTNLTETVVKRVAYTTTDHVSDWDTTLRKRGFEDIISDFLQCVEYGKSPVITADDALVTHFLCEEIVQKLNDQPTE